MGNFSLILTDDHENSSPKEHDDGLEEVGPHNGREAPHDGEQSGHSQKEEDTQVEPLIWPLVECLLHEESAGVQVRLEATDNSVTRVSCGNTLVEQLRE